MTLVKRDLDMSDARNKNEDAPTPPDAPALGGSDPEPGDAREPGDLLAALDQFRRTERLIVAERVGAYLGHELGTPLNVVEARAMMVASGDMTEAELAKNARIIAEQAGRMAKMIREALTFLRRHPFKSEPVDLLAIAKDALALSAPFAEERGVRLRLDPESEAAEVIGSREKLLQAAMDLVSNGVQATAVGGTVTVAARIKRRPPFDEPKGDDVEFATLEVRDEGPGVPEASREDIWKSFFTTKSSGLGLGLAIAQVIVRDHRGRIDVTSDVGRGSSFTVYLPRGAS
jgi:signal transduction histidine kinase